jgi:hypothetical protein
MYATISLEKYEVTKILENSVVLITPNNAKIPGIFESYVIDDLGNVIGAKYYFDKEAVLEDIAPVDVTVPLTVTGDNYSKWREISFSGEGTIKIKI